MSKVLKLKVTKSTLSSNGGYIITLQSKESKSMQTPFGLKTQESQLTYYMKVTEAQPIGKEADMDINLFDVVERPYTIPATPASFVANPAQPDPTQPNHLIISAPAQPEVIVGLKWLQIK
jgi:hypothetical protein